MSHPYIETLIQDALDAEETFSLDDLERFAADLRRKEEPCGTAAQQS